jgi:hypothetical protein
VQTCRRNAKRRHSSTYANRTTDFTRIKMTADVLCKNLPLVFPYGAANGGGIDQIRAFGYYREALRKC